MILTHDEYFNRFSELCEFIKNNFDEYVEDRERVLFTIKLGRLKVSLMNDYPYSTIYLHEDIPEGMLLIGALTSKNQKLVSDGKKFFKIYDELMCEV